MALDLGPVQIGNILSSFLHGCATCQTIFYFKNYNDPIPIRILVAALSVTGLAHQICIWVDCYTWAVAAAIISDDPNPPVSKVSDVMTVLTSIVNLLAQSFFFIRLFKLTKKPVFSSLLAAWMLARFGLGLFIGARSFQSPRLLEMRLSTGKIIGVCWILGIVWDVLVTGALCRALYLQKRHVNTLRITARLVDVLVVWCLATGLLACINTSLLTALYFAFPTNLTWTTFWYCLPSIYVNSILFALNGRQRLKRFTSATAGPGTSRLDELLRAVP